jgi:hypothetical protein
MKHLTRNEAIDALRTKLLTLVDDEHSICEVATRRGIFCGGFAQWSAGELRKRHDWIVAGRPAVKRPELEDLANRWQLARQYVLGTPIACDTQANECEHHRTCGGWTDFTDEQLGRFCRELLGEEVELVQ